MRLPRIVGAAAAVVSTLTVLLAPGAAHAAPGDTIVLPVRDALAVQDEDRTGYERSKFRHWVDADRDGCNTRSEGIWGPYRFRPGIDRADQLGRTSDTIHLEATDHTRLALDPSVRPDWYEGQDGEERWRRDYGSLPMRLWAECEAPGHKPWRLPPTSPTVATMSSPVPRSPALEHHN
ncbi:hypothetical protein ACFY8N_39095 [Streptomyces collinus]|uniref:hypothetical protein n=1 Tax=Streptomyces collinus TaxID=42684 RepID=UPI00367B46B2